MIQNRSARWRFRLLLLAALLPLLPMLGCASNNTDRGLLTGGALGAVAGGLIGGSRGHAGAGALVGGVIGAAAGGLTGAAVDNSERRVASRQVAQRTLALQDIVSLTASGSSDEVIISQIRNSNCGYTLRTVDVIYLQDNGVREPVIRFMQAMGARPVYEVQPVYVVQPAPPVGFGVGVRIR